MMTECEIKEYVDRRMRAMLDTYHEFSDVDHKGNAGFYPNGEKAYYEDTIFGLIRYYRENGKGLSKAWIKQTPNQRIKDLSTLFYYAKQHGIVLYEPKIEVMQDKPKPKPVETPKNDSFKTIGELLEYAASKNISKERLKINV